MTAEAVVKRGYVGLLASETVVIPGLYNHSSIQPVAPGLSRRLLSEHR